MPDSTPARQAGFLLSVTGMRVYVGVIGCRSAILALTIWLTSDEWEHVPAFDYANDMPRGGWTFLFGILAVIAGMAALKVDWRHVRVALVASAILSAAWAALFLMASLDDAPIVGITGTIWLIGLAVKDLTMCSAVPVRRLQ